MKSTTNLLTKRETEVIENLSQGLVCKEIADKIAISPGTVKKHVRNIYKKWGVRNRVEATIKYAFELKKITQHILVI